MKKIVCKIITALMCLVSIPVLTTYADSTTPAIYTDTNALLEDFRDETIYFVITTRFYDGDISNNTYCWDGTAINDGDEPWRGDFKGLIEKLDYIKSLGFTAIWITPVAENASGYDYHGYHAINFKKVDKRYESDDCTYQDLIDAVHEHGMKIIQDVVFNHTGNFGEENLYPIFTKDEDADPSDIDECMIPNYDYIPKDYHSLTPDRQYYSRLNNLKNLDGNNNDKNNIYHHHGDFNWDDYTCQLAQIAGDCVDLNTENPYVYKYIVDAYGKYIKMGVDAFRVDTVRHMSRLSLNKGYITQLNDIYNQVHNTTGEGNFFMFGEVCTRYNTVWYREVPALSTPFYTWKESKEYPWIDDENDPEAYITNMESAQQHYLDNDKDDIASQPTSTNAFLTDNTYHTPDHSMASGLNVIDFPMHWNFKTAKSAFNVAVSSDKYYNDATYNVVYVDSHDYAPDGAPESLRFNQSQETWAENLDLMFTFRGIPCLYYGSEIEFQKGKTIDKGPNIALADSGRAYFGDKIEGNIDAVDFAKYTNAEGNIKETLNYPLSLHIQRLNRLRAAIPALRRGQYSVSDISSSNIAFKRRYTDEITDSFVLVAISGNATFKNIPDGRYCDAITGNVKYVNNGTLTAEVSNKADMRVYVLDTELTKSPGMVAGESNYLSGGSQVVVIDNPVTGLSLEQKNITVELGETAKIKATVTPSNATEKVITWKSTDEKVVKIDNGVVIPVSQGTADIIVSTVNGLSASTSVKVTASGIQPEKVELNAGETELTIGESFEASAIISPADTTNQTIKWESSDSNIAKVKDGVITAKSIGTACIKATAVNGVSAALTVTVKSKVVTGDVMYFEKPESWSNSIKCYIWNDTYTNSGWPGVSMEEYSDGIYVIEYPADKTELNVIFNDGSNQTGDLKAVVNGYYNKDGYVKTDSLEKIEVEKVVVSDQSVEMKLDEEKKLSASVLPENADNKKIVYSTSDSKVIKVEKDGTLKPENAGSAEIYCTANNGIVSKITVNVKSDSNQEVIQNKINITSFENNATDNSLLKGGSVKYIVKAESTNGLPLEYRFYYEDGTNKNIIKEYDSVNEVVFTPENTGKYNIYCDVKDSEGNTVQAVIKGLYVHNENETPDIPEELRIEQFNTGKASGKAKVGSKIVLSAVAAGGYDGYMYKFAYKYKGKVTDISDYGKSSEVTWKIKHSGKYNLYIYIKDGIGNVVSKQIKNYTVKKKTIKIKSVLPDIKSAKSAKGKKIQINTIATGGYGTLKYKYTYKLNGKMVKICNYKKNSKVSWTIPKKGTYTLYVYVKDSDNQVVKKTLKYNVKK